MRKFLIPAIIFGVLAAFMGVGLYHAADPQADQVPSPLVGKQAPSFQLRALASPERMVTKEELLGEVYLLNVWASWCVACRQEHPVLMRLARSGQVPIYGLNYKDESTEAQQWLERHGDPYRTSLVDAEGRVGMDYGVYGVPETYVIDKEGVIRHKHIGPISPQALQDEILPLVRKLQG